MSDLTRLIPLNFRLMANPFNWAIVTLMVLIGALALNIIVPAPAATAPAPKED